jgi:hypothetical protein
MSTAGLKRIEMLCSLNEAFHQNTALLESRVFVIVVIINCVIYPGHRKNSLGRMKLY